MSAKRLRGQVRAFVNFDDYKAFLLEQVMAIHTNASDPPSPDYPSSSHG